MGNKEEEHKYECQIKTLKNQDDANKRNVELQKYINDNNLKMYQAEIERLMQLDKQQFDLALEEFEFKIMAKKMELENQRKDDSEKNENEKLKILNDFNIKREELKSKEKEIENENIRKTKEMVLKNELDIKTLNGQMQIENKKLNDEKEIKIKCEENRHNEILEQNKLKELEIEKNQEKLREENKLRFQQNENLLKENLDKSNKSHELSLKNIDLELIKYQEDKKLDMIKNEEEHELKIKELDTNSQNKLIITKTECELKILEAKARLESLKSINNKWNYMNNNMPNNFCNNYSNNVIEQTPQNGNPNQMNQMNSGFQNQMNQMNYGFQNQMNQMNYGFQNQMNQMYQPPYQQTPFNINYQAQNSMPFQMQCNMNNMNLSNSTQFTQNNMALSMNNINNAN